MVDFLYELNEAGVVPAEGVRRQLSGKD